MPISLYGDTSWNLTPLIAHANVNRRRKVIDWQSFPERWRETAKEVIHAFWLVPHNRYRRLDVAGLDTATALIRSFMKWLDVQGVRRLSEISPVHCSEYARYLKNKNDPRSVANTLSMIKRIYDYGKQLTYPMTAHPFRGRSGYVTAGADIDCRRGEARTELIPLEHAAQWMTKAVKIPDDAPRLMNLRDEMKDCLHRRAQMRKAGTQRVHGIPSPAQLINQAGFDDIVDFEKCLHDIRTAAYVVLAMGTGCRNGELSEAEVGCVFSTVHNGDTYFWMKSTTRKIGDGPRLWLAPSIAKQAIDVLERWSAPLRETLRQRIAGWMREYEDASEAGDKGRKALLAEIRNAEVNVNRLFLGLDCRRNNRIEPLSIQGHGANLRNFAQRQGLEFEVSTHQFRRTYAVILVHMEKGIDPVQLRSHYKHETMHMTQLYFSLTGADKELHQMVIDERLYFDVGLVANWLDQGTVLAGGLGQRIRAYSADHSFEVMTDRRKLASQVCESVTVRATGHSWCMAEGNDCGGRGLFEATHCADCGNSVIDKTHAPIWRGIYFQQRELLELDDIGPGGRARARRDLERTRAVLARLGIDLPHDEEL